MKITDAQMVGGIKVQGSIFELSQPKIQAEISMEDYPLENLNNLISRTGQKELDGQLSTQLNIAGPLLRPMIQGKITLKNTTMAEDPIKNMQIEMRGIYPDMNLSMSRVVTMDGTTMNLANQDVSFIELFKSDTYKQLVRMRDQTDVSWGDWKLSRSLNDEEIYLEHGVGDSMKLRYEERQDISSTPHLSDKQQDMEMEYSLTHSDSLKLRKMEDGEFVGVQKKLQF